MSETRVSRWNKIFQNIMLQLDSWINDFEFCCGIVSSELLYLLIQDNYGFIHASPTNSSPRLAGLTLEFTPTLVDAWKLTVPIPMPAWLWTTSRTHMHPFHNSIQTPSDPNPIKGITGITALQLRTKTKIQFLMLRIMKQHTIKTRQIQTSTKL